MTDVIPELTVEAGDAGVIAELAAKAVPTQTVQVVPDRRTLVVGHGPAGPVTVADVDLEVLAPYPTFKRGAVELHTAAALAGYAERHVDDDTSTVWGDVEQGRITVLFNDHGATTEGAPGWADHRASVQLRRSLEWDAWSSIDGRLMGQVELAEFLEERRLDVVDPSGSDLLDVVQTFHATSHARFKKSVVLQSGQQQLTYDEHIDASATAGMTTVPREITLALRPWLGLDPVEVTAAFRFRLRDGSLSLGVQLRNRKEISDAGVLSALEEVTTELGLPGLLGTPPAARR